ncbi:hypothetical protein D3C81_1777580 [compost metagenome]
MPNRNGPLSLATRRHSDHSATIRSISTCTSSGMFSSASSRDRSNGMAPRRAKKPLCICAQAERAWARAATSTGHKWASGWRSLRYSAMARESAITPCSVLSSGTLPVEENARMR